MSSSSSFGLCSFSSSCIFILHREVMPCWLCTRIVCTSHRTLCGPLAVQMGNANWPFIALSYLHTIVFGLQSFILRRSSVMRLDCLLGSQDWKYTCGYSTVLPFCVESECLGEMIAFLLPFPKAIVIYSSGQTHFSGSDDNNMADSLEFCFYQEQKLAVFPNFISLLNRLY